MRKTNSSKFCTVAPIAILAVLGTPVWADVLPDNALIGTSGGGLIFNDPEEGVLEPGIKAVTFTSTRDPNDSNVFLAPYENIILDYGDASGDGSATNDPLPNRGAAPNCLMANNPDIYCDSASGSGKRIKTWLTGRAPFDMRIRTSPTYANEAGAAVDVSSVDYFTFGKISNFTGARITGLSLELMTADGAKMGTLDPADAVLFNLQSDVVANLGNGARLVDGLFGAGGNENTIGFFDENRAPFSINRTSDTLDFGATNLLSNVFYIDNFGTAFLDNSMIPDGLFWDDNSDPTDESALVAWNDIAGGGWTYGNLALPGTDTNARLNELATTLGVSETNLAYAPGDLVPDAIVAAAQANGLFAVDPIEDLRNANLNYTITVNTIDGNEFIIRTAPRFAPIVEETSGEYQFRTAGYLDGAANVPYLDIGNAVEYQTAIADILALDAAEQAEAVERVGFSYLGAFAGLGMNLGRDQVFALGRPSVEVGARVSSMGANGWAMGDNLRGFASLQGSSSEYESTANNIGYDVRTMGFSAGVEAAISPSASFGVMVGGLDGKADAFVGRGSVDASGWSVAAFGRTTFGQGGSLQGIVGYQDLSFNTSRSAFGGAVAKGSTDGSQTFLAFQADYMFRQGALTWGPMASIERYKMSVDGFNETGAGIWNLAVGAQSGLTTLASAGVRGEYMVDPSGATRAYGSLALTKSSGDDQMISSGFVGLPSGLTPVDAIDQNWVDLKLGMSTVIAQGAGKQTLVGAEYRGSYGSSYKSHGMGVFVKMKF